MTPKGDAIVGEFNKVEYNYEFNQKSYDRLNCFIPKGMKEVWKSYAKREGRSLTAYIMNAVGEHEDKIKAENQNPKPD